MDEVLNKSSSQWSKLIRFVSETKQKGMYYRNFGILGCFFFFFFAIIHQERYRLYRLYQTNSKSRSNI